MQDGYTHFIWVKKNSEYRYIASFGQKFHQKNFILSYAKITEEGENLPHIGITASRKVGNAVKRNFAKRRLRSAIHILLKKLNIPHMRYNIIAKSTLLEVPFNNLLHELESSFLTAYDKSSSHSS